MHVTKVYISELLQILCEGFAEALGATVYSEHRPLALQELADEFLVISLPSLVQDQNAFQKTTLRISVYVKNKANGIVNTSRLNEIAQSVCGMFPYVSGRYSATRPEVALKSDDGLGFTVWIIQANLQINTTDSYTYE